MDPLLWALIALIVLMTVYLASLATYLKIQRMKGRP